MCGVTGAVCIYMEEIMEAKGLREMNSDILKHIQITKAGSLKAYEGG